MARPKKEGLEYFPHDVDLSSDEKIEALEAHYGLAGYAVFLKLLERIYRAGGYLHLTDDLTLVLAKKYGITVDQLNGIISVSVQQKLFYFKNGPIGRVVTSKGIGRRMRAVSAKRAEWREKKGGKKFSPEKTKGKLGENPTKESKVKESKVKEIIKERDIGDAPFEKKETPRTSTGLPEQEKAFKQFWENYPARNGKKLEEQETFRRFCLVPQEDWPQLIQATKHYAASEAVTDGIGIKDPKNFIGDQATERSFWKEWIKPEIKAPQGASNAHKSNPQSTRTQAGGIRGEASAYDANIIRFGEGEDGDPGG